MKKANFENVCPTKIGSKLQFMNTIFWTGYCNNDRIIAISGIEKIIGDYGYILDFKQFSDISITLKIELEETKY